MNVMIQNLKIKTVCRLWSLFPGGEVTFDLKNDAPTLTGGRTTFTINLNFPPNQTVLSDGQVVWARNCTVDGRTTLTQQFLPLPLCVFI